jgi:hypothetical protein
VTFFYGTSIFLGIVFPKGSVSWEAHLAGALAGLAYARLELLAGAAEDQVNREPDFASPAGLHPVTPRSGRRAG